MSLAALAGSGGQVRPCGGTGTLKALQPFPRHVLGTEPRVGSGAGIVTVPVAPAAKVSEVTDGVMLGPATAGETAME